MQWLGNESFILTYVGLFAFKFYSIIWPWTFSIDCSMNATIEKCFFVSSANLWQPQDGECTRSGKNLVTIYDTIYVLLYLTAPCTHQCIQCTIGVVTNHHELVADSRFWLLPSRGFQVCGLTLWNLCRAVSQRCDLVNLEIFSVLFQATLVVSKLQSVSY